jgi:capsular exopolysaccharide synthesis family protein
MKQAKNQVSILSLFDKESAIGTEFRRLYTNIKVRAREAKLQNIMITSATVGEGKSLISSLLAVTIADLTKMKVALVDFDLRRPRLCEYFQIDDTSGLTDVLTGKLTLKEVSRKSPMPNLTIVPSGKLNGNPTDILDQENVAGIFQELRFYFDFVVVDSPPVIPVSDPLLIAESIDGVLLVVRGGVTQREVVLRAANLLVNSSVNLLGVVLNDYEEVLPYYFKERYYGYKYYHKKSGDSSAV